MLIIATFIIALLICRSNIKGGIHIAILLFGLLFSMRNDLVPDTIPYRDLFNQNISLETSSEVGYLYLCYFFHNILGTSFSQFLFVFTVIFMEIWCFITKKMLPGYQLPMLFIGFMSYFGLFYFGIVLRSSLAILTVYWGLTFLIKKSIPGSIVFILSLGLAFLFHKTSIIFLLAFVSLISYNKYILYTLIGVAILAALTHPFASIQGQLELFLGASEEFSKYNSYAMDETLNTGFDAIFTSYVLIGLVGVYMRKYIGNSERERVIYNLLLNLYVIGILLDSVMSDFRAGGRLPMQFLYFEVIIVYMILFKNRKTAKLNAKPLYFTLFVLAKLTLLLHRTPLLLNY